jgi:hypothetical protein
VRYIVGADAVHWLFLREFQTAYPDARVLAVEDVLPKVKKSGLRVDGCASPALLAH